MVIMVMAGVMLWVNLHRAYEHTPTGWEVDWGWPRKIHVHVVQPVGTVFREYVYEVSYLTGDWTSYAINALVAALMILAILLCFEFLFHRHKS